MTVPSRSASMTLYLSATKPTELQIAWQLGGLTVLTVHADKSEVRRMINMLSDRLDVMSSPAANQEPTP